MASGSRVAAKDLELELRMPVSRRPATTLKRAREQVEREMIQQALKRHAGRITRAAAELGISRPTLYELMDKLGISKRTTISFQVTSSNTSNASKSETVFHDPSENLVPE